MVVLYIIGGIVVCLGTYVGTVLLGIKAVNNMSIFLAEKGFKYDYKKWEENNQNYVPDDEEKSQIKSATILQYIPVVNLMLATVGYFRRKKQITNAVKNMKNVIMPMSEKEVADFCKLNTRREKLSYIKQMTRDYFENEYSYDEEIEEEYEYMEKMPTNITHEYTNEESQNIDQTNNLTKENKFKR